jgi:PAS domain S-box-containing protein
MENRSPLQTAEQRVLDLEKKKRELHLNEERYHQMIAEIQDYAIILLDKEGIIQNWNKGAEKIKGYSAEEAIGKSIKMFYTPEDQQRNIFGKLMEEARNEGRASHEGWRVTKNGRKFWGSVVFTALHDPAGEVIGYSKVTRDLTEKREAEQRLQDKNQELEAMNQELSSFAYVSSHDLQEPLRKIQTFASRILESDFNNLSDKGKDYFQRMQNAALRMQTLIEDLLAYSRTNTSDKNFESADLNELINNALIELNESIEEKRAIVTISKLPRLDVIAFQFKQLVTNIISNALKFSRPDAAPEIKITGEEVEEREIKVPHKTAYRKYLHIAFSDNGIGFEEEHKEKIFDLFQRLHGRSEYSGTGIGLAICKKIMDNHEGVINAESTLGVGSTFHVYFPIKYEKASA